MKKGLKLLVATLFMVPIGVSAATVDVSLSCPATATANSEVSCVIKATPSGADLKGIEGKYNITGGSYSGFSLDSGWVVYSSNEIGFSLGKTEATTSSVNVGTLKVKVPASGNVVVKLTDVYGANSSYDTLNSSGASKTIRVKSGVNTLETLSMSGAQIAFDKNTLKYDVTIDAASTVVVATKTDSYSTVSGLGNVKLNYGKNTINVVVTAEDGTKKTYVINVERPDNRSTNNNLSTLSISSGQISFNKNTTSYDVEVDTNVDKFSIDATLEDSKATFVKGYGSRTVNLNYGKNVIQIKVKSEKGTEKVYTVNVTRKDNRSGNTNLSSLTLSSGNLSFSKDVTEYQVSVENEIEEIQVSAAVEDSKSKVEFPTTVKLQLGSNEFKVKVVAENGSTKEYKVIVIRKEKNQVLDNNNYLKQLSIAGYNIDFNKDKLTYDLTIKDETKLDVTFTLDSGKAMATCTGNENLEDGSVIKVSVYAEDGSIREYVINIKKSSEDKDEPENPISFSIAVGVFGVGLLTFIGSICYIKSR